LKKPKEQKKEHNEKISNIPTITNLKNEKCKNYLLNNPMSNQKICKYKSLTANKKIEAKKLQNNRIINSRLAK
jgi:hypothetical protein